MHSGKNLPYYFALILVIFIWAAAFVITKAALITFGPFVLSALRMFLALIVILPIAIKRGFHFKSLFTKTACIFGIFGYGSNLVLSSFGLKICNAGIASIISGLFPIFMFVFGRILLDERISRNKALGIAFSVGGICITSEGTLFNSSGATLPGIILLILSALTWAFYSVYSKKVGEGMDAFVLSAIGIGSAFLWMLPFAVGELIITGFVIPDTGAIISLVYLGALSGGIGIVLWNYALKKVNLAVAGIYNNLVPAIGLFFAFLAHEPISLSQILGCALIFIGVLIGTNNSL